MQHAPAADRNKDPILSVLRTYLPTPERSGGTRDGIVVEIASGTGQHIVHFAQAFPNLLFQPSDRDERCIKSITAYIEQSGVTNVLSPVLLDCSVTTEPWCLETREYANLAGVEGRSLISNVDAILCINMIHISKWDSCVGLMQGAGRLLKEGGLLYLYGPFKINGKCTTLSNEEFDANLRMQNPEWGLRDIADVTRVALQNGLVLVDRVEMPANNFSFIFHKRTRQHIQ